MWQGSVMDSMMELGGEVDSQGVLKDLVAGKLNCGETTARKAINHTCKENKLIAIPGGKGVPNGYKIPK